MPDLAIIIPTRGRPQNIARLIQAWTDTEAWSADMIIVADADDPEIQRYREFEDLEFPIQVIVESHWVPMVHKLDSTAVALAEFEYWAVGFAGDDHLPRTGSWVSRYVAELRDMETGIVYGDDGYQGANLPTEWAMTSDIIRALGRMVPAPVEHMYCDNSIRDLGRGAGCIRHLPDVVIEHLNPYAGKGELDDQYRRVNSRDQFRRDRGTYQRWQRQELPAQIESVRNLMPERYRITAGLQPGGEIVTRPAVRRHPTRRPNMRVPRRLLRVQGATPLDICITLADLATQVPAGRAIVELGVFRGSTAIIMAWGAQRGGRAHVWGVDAWDLPGNTYHKPFTDPGSRNWARYNVKALGYANHVTLIQGFSVEQAGYWSGPPIGLLFVDADHSYEGVWADVEAWSRHLADDAVLAFDDYGHPDWPGVKTAVDEMVERGVLDPVQIFHDRLAVTRLGSGHPELVRREAAQDQVQRGEWVTDPASKVDLSPDGEELAEGFTQLPPDALSTETDLGKPCPPEDSVYALPEAVEGDSTMHESPGTGERMEPEPAPASHRVPMEPAPDPVREAREVVLPSELEGLETQTTLENLNVAQLRELAKARGVTLGRDRKTREAALTALREGQ